MTIFQQIERIERVFQRKYSAEQRTELAETLSKEILPVDIASVASDYVWNRKPGMPMPSPRDLREQCLNERARRVRRERERNAPKRTGDALADVAATLAERGGGSYHMAILDKAFAALLRSGSLGVPAYRQKEAEDVAIYEPRYRAIVREVIRRNPFDETRWEWRERLDEKHLPRDQHGELEPRAPRTALLARIVNEELATIDFDPFADMP